MNQALLNSLLKVAIRRGLTLLGSAGAAVSDDWIAQTASLLLVIGNEAWNWHQSHKAEKAKGETVKVAA